MPTKLDYAVIAVLLAAGLIALESSHRIELAAPAMAAPGPKEDPCASADMRYGASRLLFSTGGFASGPRPRQFLADAPANCVR
jgi:hypothetical protein